MNDNNNNKSDDDTTTNNNSYNNDNNKSNDDTNIGIQDNRRISSAAKVSIFLNGPFTACFYFIFVFSIQYSWQLINVLWKFADVWIRTADLWY